MANYTAATVKELREMTGAGMMECKKALTEADGNLDAAVDILRTAGLAAVAKKAGRATDEGTIAASVSADGHTGALVELNCETDFVGINDKFKAYADKIALAAIANNAGDLDALLACEYEGETVDAMVADAIHTIGENIKVSKVAVCSAPEGGISTYIHAGGKIAVMVQFTLGNPDLASSDNFARLGRDVAMHVAATNPVSATRNEVDPAIVEHELSIFRAQAAESGKPEAIQEKMAQGRIEKFYKESVLAEQMFVKNPDISVADHVSACAKEIGTSVEILAFVRFALGE